MKVLTDTHALVWALSDPDSLSRKARKALTESNVMASVANLWELILKKERHDALLADPIKWWDKYVANNGIPALPIQAAHIRELGFLAHLHKDPFDRILVAQSIVENLPLVSKDPQLAAYGIRTIW